MTTAESARTLGVYAISLGERHRTDLGDIDALARSIEEVGLLHPIVVTGEGKLIAGERRLMACRQLGWDEIPVTVIELEEIIRGEVAENQMRKDFTPSEMVAIGQILEERERGRAKDRQGYRSSGTVPELEHGQVRDIVGKAVGVSGRTYERARAVVEAAQADPAAYGSLVEEMDARGVKPAYHKLREKQTAGSLAARSKTPEAVAERYDTIRQMAADRHRSYDIAAKVGMSDETVRALLRKWGIETVEDRIGKNGRRLDANKIMESVVANAGPTDQTVGVLFASWGELDETKFPEWEGSLNETIKLLTKIRNRLRKEPA